METLSRRYVGYYEFFRTLLIINAVFSRATRV